MNRTLKNLLTLALLLVFLALFTFGITTNEANLVLQKSVNICLECIGIG